MTMARGARELTGSIDREAVLRAIAEFDRLGREQFLRQYGFNKARTYMLQHEDKLYDAKAIIGVAYGMANPNEPHLSGRDFHSGEGAVRRRLNRLGFTVIGASGTSEGALTDNLAAQDQVEHDADARGEGGYGARDIIDDGCFIPEAEVVQMIETLRTKKNLILQGPPGTGKTWLAKRLGYAVHGSRVEAEGLKVVQFHPSVSYEDFVRGYRPSKDAQLELTDGIFLEAVQKALDHPERPMVLVVEEINRGNPAQIFGEMLTLLESTKRLPEEAIELAYRKRAGEVVYIPENLYVIGTMNVADRSLALVDLALRRRFAFVTLTPRMEEEWASWCRDRAGLSQDVVSLVQTRMKAVNQTIAEDRALGAQFQLGHSFVTPTQRVPEGQGRAWFRRVVVTEIHPLLAEYWFDQPEKADQARNALLASLGA
jgi:5-methylcytosine-specific restriction protein B